MVTAPVHDARPLAVRVYDRICSDIINGTLPAGTPLVQEQIAAQYGVSRTPVRDALTQLSMEGLATLVPGRGYVVNDLTDQDVKNLYEVRYTLEALAARQACGHHTSQQLVRLRALVDEYETVDPSDAEELYRLGLKFHTALVEPCPNQYLQTMLAGIWVHPIQRRINMTYSQGPDLQAKVARDHRRVLDALADNDAETMVELLHGCFHVPHGQGAN